MNLIKKTVSVTFMICLCTSGALAAPALDQSFSASSDDVSTVSTTYGTTPTTNDLLIVICGAKDADTFTTPTGFTIINTPNNSGPSLFSYYKVSAGTEGKIDCVSSGSTADITMSIYEYSGLESASPLDDAADGTGSSATVSLIEITNTTANSLIFGAVINDDSGSHTWTAPFTELFDFKIGGADKTTHGTADRSVTAIGTYSAETVMIKPGNQAWQIFNFKAPDAGLKKGAIIMIQ